MTLPTLNGLRRWEFAELGLKVGSGLCALALAALLAFRTSSPPASPRPKPVTIYTPSVPAGEKYSELESPANGFIFVVETLPEGVDVIVNGKSQGTTPASFNYECTPGNPLALELKAPGFTSMKRTLQCKKDVMMVLNARLQRPR